MESLIPRIDSHSNLQRKPPCSVYPRNHLRLSSLNLQTASAVHLSRCKTPLRRQARRQRAVFNYQPMLVRFGNISTHGIASSSSSIGAMSTFCRVVWSTRKMLACSRTHDFLNAPPALRLSDVLNSEPRAVTHQRSDRQQVGDIAPRSRPRSTDSTPQCRNHWCLSLRSKS